MISIKESKFLARLFYFRVYRITSYAQKRTIFDNIFEQFDCDLVLTATKQDCIEGFYIHDIVIRLKTEV